MMEPMTPNKADRRMPLRTLYAAVSIALLSLMGITGMLPVFRERLQEFLSISKTEFGLLLTLGSVVGIAGALTGGWLVDRGGARRVLRICLVGSAVGMGAAACGGPWWVLLCGLCTLTLFSQPLNIATQAYLVRLFPTSRRRVLTLNLVFASLFSMGFSLLAERLLQMSIAGVLDFGQVLYLPFAIMAAVVLGAALIYRKRPRFEALPVRVGHTPKPWASFALGGGTILLASMMVIHVMCDMSAYYWMPTVLGSKSFELTRGQGIAPGTALAGSALAYVVSRGLLTFLPEHWGRRTMLVAPGLLGGGLLLAGVLSRSQPLLAAGYIAGAFCWSLEYPAILERLSHDKEKFGSALALQTVAAGVMVFLMSTGMGYIGDQLPPQSLWQVLLIPACGFPLVSLGGVVWLARYGRRDS